MTIGQSPRHERASDRLLPFDNTAHVALGDAVGLILSHQNIAVRQGLNVERQTSPSIFQRV